MIKFKKLKVKGFKSFVEPTEVIIEQGLTGIVGLNGCGKSNLVEAFRFVMGELSPKQMRGSELDDVIFNGTSGRPAWDIAEVTIDLDNTDRQAPSLFNQSDEIEVTRRIWRGEGSEYRVNGKEVRLKDVQLLFADAATGARSTSMVSQGRVGAIIAAKPEQRRNLLEEAAGITGLHSRRHEAELRLNATETNLERISSYRETTAWVSFEMLDGASEANSIRSAVVWLTSCGLSKVRFVKGESGLAKMPSFLQKLDDKNRRHVIRVFGIWKLLGLFQKQALHHLMVQQDQNW